MSYETPAAKYRQQKTTEGERLNFDYDSRNKRACSQPPSTTKPRHSARSRRSRRQRSFSPPTHNKSRFRRRSRSRSRGETSKCTRAHRPSEFTIKTTPNKNYFRAFGVDIPGEIIAIDNGIGWIYSNYQSRNQMYQFSVRNIEKKSNPSFLDKGQFVLFDHNNMWASHIRLTTHFSYDKIKSLLTEDNLSIHSSEWYVFKTKLDCHEDIRTEFKLCRNGPSYALLMKFLNGFVNSDGGTIYFGINNDGIVEGVQHFNHQKMDKFLLYVDSRLKKWKPKQYYSLLKRSVKIDFVKIVKFDEQSKIGYIVPNSVVVRCSIKTIPNGNKQITFTDSYHRSYFKLQASIEEDQMFDH